MNYIRLRISFVITKLNTIRFSRLYSLSGLFGQRQFLAKISFCHCITSVIVSLWPMQNIAKISFCHRQIAIQFGLLNHIRRPVSFANAISLNTIQFSNCIHLRVSSTNANFPYNLFSQSYSVAGLVCRCKIAI